MVDRAVALVAVAGRGEKAPVALVSRVVDDFSVRAKLTPLERAFMEDSHSPQRNLIQFSWRYEALRVLLWSLHFLPGLPRPEAPVDPAVLGRIVLGGTEAALRERARLRSGADLLDLSNLMYRYH